MKTNKELKEEFINKFGDSTAKYNHREEVIADWWLAARSALLTEIAGEVEKMKLPKKYINKENSNDAAKLNSGLDTALQIINSYKNEDKD